LPAAITLAAAIAAIFVASSANADSPVDPIAETASADAKRLTQPPGSSMRFLASLALGDGLRFNNPFRLETELGSDARSLSLTRGYVDFGAAFAVGPPGGFQHGAALRLSVALGGVAQQVLTPSYFIAYRGPRRVMAYGRLGPSIILSPDANVGGEIAVGGAYFLTAGIAASAEIIGDLYYGAGTPDAGASVVPVVSAQLGILIDYEVLP
jgi:hypothetical protein